MVKSPKTPSTSPMFRGRPEKSPRMPSRELPIAPLFAMPSHSTKSCWGVSQRNG